MRGHALGELAAIARGLAAHQVIGLNGGGAFIDGQDARVAVVLRGARFFNEAHAAMHLHAQAGDFQADFRAVALDQRHQEFIESLALLARGLVGRVVRGVIRGGGHAGGGARAFGEGAHGHEHAADVGVVNDGRAAGQAAIHGAALHALAGIGHGFLVGTA